MVEVFVPVDKPSCPSSQAPKCVASREGVRIGAAQGPFSLTRTHQTHTIRKCLVNENMQHTGAQ